MTNFNCEETQMRVFDYLSNELDDKSKLQVTTHLSECSKCELEFEIERKISRIVSSSSSDPVSSAKFFSQVSDRLRSEE
jgi:anti-sigma factor RsiW